MFHVPQQSEILNKISIRGQILRISHNRGIGGVSLIVVADLIDNGNLPGNETNIK